jgi:hypothetical protein
MSDPSTFEQQLARLGESIAAHGVGRFEAELTALAARARRVRPGSVALDVLLDRAAPAVVRERAFAHVCRALVAAGSGEPTGGRVLAAA